MSITMPDRQTVFKIIDSNVIKIVLLIFCVILLYLGPDGNFREHSYISGLLITAGMGSFLLTIRCICRYEYKNNRKKFILLFFSSLFMILVFFNLFLFLRILILSYRMNIITTFLRPNSIFFSGMILAFISHKIWNSPYFIPVMILCFCMNKMIGLYTYEQFFFWGWITNSIGITHVGYFFHANSVIYPEFRDIFNMWQYQ